MVGESLRQGVRGSLDRPRTKSRDNSDQIKLMTSDSNAALPEVGLTACYSIHKTFEKYVEPLPMEVPWSHQAPVNETALESIEN